MSLKTSKEAAAQPGDNKPLCGVICPRALRVRGLVFSATGRMQQFGTTGKVSLPSRQTSGILAPMSYAPGIAALNASALLGGLLLLIRP